MGLKDAFAALFGIGTAPQRQANTPSAGSDFWYETAGSGKNSSGLILTPDISLKNAPEYTCVKILAETIASMPCGVYRELPDGGREPAPEHPLDELIRFQPNTIQTAAEFWEMMVFHAVLRGTGYAEIIPGARGAVHELKPLHTDRVQMQVLRDGTLRFLVTNPLTGERRVLLQEEMFRIPGLSSDGLVGLRSVDIAAEDIGLGMAADAYAGRVFSNKLNIGGYLIHPNKLSPEAQKNLIQRLMERFAGIDNAHRPIVLQEGMKFEKASMDAKDAQLLEARLYQAKLIAMRLRIPLYMLGLAERKGDSEQEAIDFRELVLRPWVRRIEQAIRRDLIVAKRTYFAAFNMDAMARASLAVRADMSAKVLGSGGSPASWTQNEVRTKIWGLNRIDDPRADTLGVGTNPVTSEPVGTRALSAPPVRAALSDDTPEGRAARLVRKEVAAIRKASLRFAGDKAAFAGWVKSFYSGHGSCVAETLGIPKDAARQYCVYVRGEVLKAKDIGALLEHWEETRAAEIAKTLREPVAA